MAAFEDIIPSDSMVLSEENDSFAKEESNRVSLSTSEGTEGNPSTEATSDTVCSFSEMNIADTEPTTECMDPIQGPVVEETMSSAHSSVTEDNVPLLNTSICPRPFNTTSTVIAASTVANPDMEQIFFTYVLYM